MRENILKQIREASEKTGHVSGCYKHKLGYRPSDPVFEKCIDDLIKEGLIKYHETPTGKVLTSIKEL